MNASPIAKLLCCLNLLLVATPLVADTAGAAPQRRTPSPKALAS